MSFQHDQMAHIATTKLIADIRSGRSEWLPANRLTTNSTYWQGVLDWPRPDNAFQDSSTGASLALEFKPPGHGKSEYVRGMGQALTYLDMFELSLLVVPFKANDDFQIADYLRRVLDGPYADNLSVGIMAYGADPAVLEAVIPVRPRPGVAPPLPTGRAVFWAYWRDLSQYDLFVLLSNMDKGQCVFNIAHEKYWTKTRTTGKALNWEGGRRKKPALDKSHASERANDSLSLRHLGLIDSSSQITADGYDLLRIGKVYGPESQAFLAKLAQRILLDGRHLELIFWVDDKQKQLAPSEKEDHDAFRANLDRELEVAGIIPHLPVASGKTTFLRDEPKLWNKLGLLMTSGPSKRKYFYRGEGYRFDWRKIVSVAALS